MKVLPQLETLALIAAYRADRQNYNTSTKEVSAQLVEELDGGTYDHSNSRAAIAGLEKQRERENAKLVTSGMK